MPSDIHLFLFWYLFLCSKEKSTSTIFFLYNTAYSIVATFVTPLVSVIRYICIIFKVKKRGVRGFSPWRHILFQIDICCLSHMDTDIKNRRQCNDTVCYSSMCLFSGRTCSVLLSVLLPAVNLLVRDGHHSSFFHIKHLPAECLGTKGCFQFRQYFHESVISAHIPEIVIHSAKRNPFKQPHACCLLHAFIKKARTDLHTLHMISFATQSIISLLPQTRAFRHVHHEYDLFR